MNIFEVIEPGFFTTIQDLGRYENESEGVPNSGAMDEYSFRIANLLLNNDENCPALEITLIGPKLLVLNDVVVALTGADMQPVVNGIKRSNWCSMPLLKGDLLSFLPMKSGLRSYLAIPGGFKSNIAFGSSSTYTRGGIGGINGRRLVPGDILEMASDSLYDTEIIPKKMSKNFIPTHINMQEIKVILGPQDDYFPPETIKTFLQSSFKITNNIDRMGYRLDGPQIVSYGENNIITDGIVPGSIQIPPNGKPIIIMKDAQTTGGYAKIATVISTDLQKIAQMKPGDKIKFKNISLQEAHEDLKSNERRIKLAVSNLKQVKYFMVTVDEKKYDVSLSDW